jgi:hypothetical protein
MESGHFPADLAALPLMRNEASRIALVNVYYIGKAGNFMTCRDFCASVPPALRVKKRNVA